MPKNSDPTVTHFENRGTPDVPYGFVYFADGTRIGFAPTVEGMFGPHGLFESNWGSCDVGHYVSAEEYLTRALQN